MSFEDGLFDETEDVDFLQKKPIPSRPLISPAEGHYVTGFVDGEGSFYVSTRLRPDYKSGWRFTAHFSVGNKDKTTIDLCQGCIGTYADSIRQVKEDFYVLEISDLPTLKALVLPFFTDYPFQTLKKSTEFELFIQIVELLEGKIKTRDQLDRFLSLRLSLDAFRKSRALYSDEKIRSSFKEEL
jgi:hypothetical protein